MLKYTELIKGKIYVLVEEDCKWIFEFKKSVLLAQLSDQIIHSKKHCCIELDGSIDTAYIKLHGSAILRESSICDNDIVREATDSEIKMLEEACAN